ncbi:lipopolysaccharide biosynthesis protein [Constantimarinum furrinae]|uniref:Polysaccharide biosynthesis protein n=1 Tax=Constantimarinum furrinae TaxID=2562285 RepID=A0A7G8PX90_9FLAO|nr:lipopolysaccharide biosynthesis protein [Constantimarinum furrinae]QNJ98956.1 Polysaccharide biosynthesis protein [Constantimarinum furrinae]
MSRLKRKILGGVFWTTTESVFNRSFDLIIQFLLAKLLFPEDFGVVGMAIVFVSFLQVVNDLGFGNALIQKKNMLLTKSHHSTAFWSGLVWSVCLLLLIYFVISPFIAAFYNEPILIKIVPALSITLLTSSLSVVQRARLTKQMQFKKLAVINSISNIIAGSLAFFLAFKGLGVWALVCYSVIKSVILVPLSFLASEWSPRLNWSEEHFKEIFGFGIFTTGTSIANVVAQKSDYLLVGKFLGATTLGYYAFAFLLTNTLRSQIAGVINKVMFPVYVTMQDEPEKLITTYLRTLSVNMMLVYPIILLIYLFAEYFLILFFGAKWTHSVPLIKILCISVFIQMWVNSNQALFRSFGRVRLEFNLQLVKSFLFFVPCIFFGIYSNGVSGAAWGFTVATLLSALLTFVYLKRIFRFPLNQYLAVLKVPLSLLLACGGSSMVLLNFIDWPFILLFYLLSVAIFFVLFAKREVRFMYQLIKHRNLTFMDEELKREY